MNADIDPILDRCCGDDGDAGDGDYDDDGE